LFGNSIILAMTTIQALNNLYNASRRAPLSAEEHEILKKSAEVLLEAIKPKEDGKVVEFDGKSP
jgi:hypothetical protein